MTNRKHDFFDYLLASIELGRVEYVRAIIERHHAELIEIGLLHPTALARNLWMASRNMLYGGYDRGTDDTREIYKSVLDARGSRWLYD